MSAASRFLHRKLGFGFMAAAEFGNTITEQAAHLTRNSTVASSESRTTRITSERTLSDSFPPEMCDTNIYMNTSVL